MVAAAVVGSAVVGGVASNVASRNASKSAASAQDRSTEASVGLQREQFNRLQELLSPYVQAGLPALQGQQNLLGLNGAEAQQSAINGISSSPQYMALAKQGEDAILSNAAATGGLRGGNAQAALSQFRPQLLNQLIDQQYNRLGGLTQLGQNSAAGVGTAGMNSANAISALYQQQGASQAGLALARGQANAQLGNTIGNSIGLYAGLGGFSGLGGGIAGGAVNNTLF